MAPGGKVRIYFDADTRGVQQGARRASGYIDGVGRSSLASARNLARVGLASAGLASVGLVFRSMVDEAREAAKTTSETEARLKSTGGVANVTASEIGNLANSLSVKAGVDDEAIQSSENLLLTFTKVRNEAGKGNDIFTQGTTAALDMSAALGTSLKSATIQVGKALNDPIKGITALGRAGVSFTQQQKDQIKTLVESGRAMDAQKLILAELNKEFGGTAAAKADPFDRFKVAIANLEETVGTALLPTFSEIVNGLTGVVVQVQNGTGPWGRFAGEVRDAFMDLRAVVAPTVQAIIGGFRGLSPELQKFAAVAAASAAIFLVGGPWGLAIAGLAAGAILIRRNWETIGPILNSAVTAVSGAISQVGQWLGLGGSDLRQFGDAARNAFNIVKGSLAILVWGFQSFALPIVRRTMAGMLQYVRGSLQVIGGVIKIFTGIFTGDFRQAWDGIKQTARGMLNQLLGVFRATTAPLRAVVAAIFRAAVSAARGVASAFYSAGRYVISKAVDGIQAVFGSLSSAGRSAANRVRDGIAGLWKAFWSVGGFLMGKVKDGLRAGLSGLASIGQSMVQQIKSGIGGIISIPFKLIGKGAGGHARGGKYMEPSFMFAEEAPRFPEYMISTNPRDRGRMVPLLMEAASDLGIPGFKSGGKKKKPKTELKVSGPDIYGKLSRQFENEDALDTAYTDPAFTVDMAARLKKIDQVLGGPGLSREDRNSLLTLRGQVWEALHPEDTGGSTSADSTAALAAAVASLAEEVKANREFAKNTSAAIQSVTDNSLAAMMDKTLGGWLAQNLLTLSPKVLT